MASDNKALDAALASIEKQFGKGSLMKLGDNEAMNVAAIPTGALSLDLALGIGGVPRGRVTEIYGPESSGKCLTADTHVWTDHGLETIQELFARVGQPTSCTSRVTDVRDRGIRLVNEEGDLELMGGVTHNNRRPVTRVTLSSGRHVDATANHPLRVLNEHGRIVWRRVGELAEGDVMVSALFGAEVATGGDHLSEDEAVLLGYLVAEGTLGATNRNSVTFTNAHDPDVYAEYVGLLGRVLDVDASRVRTYADKDHHVHDTALRQRLADEYGLDFVGSAGKDVPHRVRTAGAKVQRAFLSALYQGDGWIEEGPSIGLSSASRTLAEQVQLLLFGLGIPATLTTKHHQDLDRDYHTVLVTPGGVARFMDQIGFRSARRAEQVARHLRDVTAVTQHEHLPHGTDAGKFSDVPLTWERVVAIEDMGELPTFDVVVPETHSFVANGVLSHNTSLALHVVAEAQKAGGIAAFIDAEHALDPVYARALGVDIDELLVSQPDNGEQALEITDMLVRSGSLDVIVVDSVSALTPRAEIEGEMGDSHVGLQARLMSQALRKLAGSLAKSKTSLIFINQLREKIGVMFGCASYGTRVTLADGTQEKIGKIVNQRMDVEVRSFDFARGEFVNRKVVDWFDNGRTDEFLRFTVERGGGNGRSQFSLTRNHQVATPYGWTEAGALAVGDTVLQSVPYHLSDFQREVVLGGLMGDGALSPTRSGNGARFRWGHAASQAEYGDWKASLFANVNVSRSTNDKGAVFHDVQPLPELAPLREAVYIGGKKVLSDDYLKALTPLSLAIWYQDDGGFQLRSKGLQERTRGGTGRSEICISAFESSSQQRLVRYLADTWDLHPTFRDANGQQYLTFPVAETDKLHALVAPYVHPSMAYKLLPTYQGRFEVEVELGEVEYHPVPMPITSIVAGPPNGRHTHRFDIEVEGSHTYLADGVIVHNSPETTSGGRALKFYSSVRLDVRRIESLKDGQDMVGNRVRVKVAKNKVAPPFRKAEFDIMYGQGISREGSLLDIGVDEGFIRKAGAWYTYDGEQLGQGKENARTYLKEHPDVALEIEKRVLDKVGIAPLAPDEVIGAGDDGDDEDDDA